MSIGLGLAITQKIVNQMRGTITVESEVGVGTKVIVHLDLSIPIEKQLVDNALLK